MTGKHKYLPIASVMFTYTGDDEAFVRFLRAVVHDYVTSASITPVRGGDDE